ncbi:protein NRT1/ PTR FAMILY 2.8 [Amaranthus tricolor]|uniref:protein NRT1/ PTR FAMILY 2.8 n=1 Tax=Amaranthus tricolor TaxID=29722 RepID=UPI0025903D9C|nr:protein NRT1/ PTR FAMILY 2.8 [Amaranthus tricolor]
MSLIANITVYLRTKYNMNGLLLVNVVNIWSGSSNFLTLGGALLSDAYLGRFWTLLIGSIISMLGMGIMTLGAGVPKLRPPNCDPEADYCTPPTILQLSVLITALIVLAFGSGCLRPCNIAFGADQFDTTTERGRSQLSRFYNWWYFSFTISLLVALTVIVYIQTNISWTIGFAIPTACFGCSIIIFLVGHPYYICMKPKGSMIFFDIVKVIVASYRKRNLILDDKHEGHNPMFYDPPIQIDEQMDHMICKLSRSNRLKFLDKAALINERNELDDEGKVIDNWRLCSVQQVEQLKSLIGILPVWVAGILCFVSMDQQNTFGILQSIQMNRKVGSRFLIPPAWTGFVSMVALSVWILSYERLILPLARKLMKTENSNVRLSVSARIKIGIVMSILCMGIAAFVESKRRNEALRKGSFVSPLYVGYLVPQLILSGLTEAFAAVTIMEFFTTQMPEYMRSVAGSIFFISLSMANYLATAIVNIIYQVTRRSDGKAWLGGRDLNHNRLDYFYAIIGFIGIFNFFYFSFFASKFIFVNNKNKIIRTETFEPSSSLDTHTRME